MVERLQEAIEKARRQREQRDHAAPVLAPGPERSQDAAWERLPELDFDPAALRRERVVTHDRWHVAHLDFDKLRTRLSKVFSAAGWSRLAITSATRGCGKSVVSTNLAFSLSRQRAGRVLLVDLDLRAPRLASIFGAREHFDLGAFLQSDAPAEDHVRRVGPGLAVALNSHSTPDSSELIQDASLPVRLAALQAQIGADYVIYDLSPLLLTDDAFAALALVDAVMLVARAGVTRAAEVTEAERLIGDPNRFLGVMLNACDHAATVDEAYYG